MKTWIKLLLISLALAGHAVAVADGYGGSGNNNPPNAKNDANQDDPNGKTCKPVHLASRIEIHEVTDLSMNGLYPIVLKRYYSSSTDYDSSLGFGWAFKHDRRLFEYPDNSVIIRYGCGWKDRFVKTAGQYQTPQGGMEGILVENPDGTYERTFKDGSKDFYDTEGRLVRNQSPYGHSHQYNYDPAGLLPLTGVSDYALDPDAPMVVARQYRLVSIEEFAADGVSTGNRVEFDYHPATGRLITATAKTALDSTGRTITYVHDIDGIAKGRLEKVIGLEGIESNYEYSTTNSRLITHFQEGAGTTPYVNSYAYGAPHRVSFQDYGSNTQADESNLRLAFSYPVVAYETTVTKTVYDDQGALLYNNTKTKYGFDDAGYVNKITDPYGNETRITRDGLFNLKREEFWTNQGTTSSPDLVLSRAVDYIFDAEGNKREETVYTDGRWDRTRWTYDHGWLASEEITSNRRNARTYRTEYTFYRDGNGVPTNIHEIKRLKDDGSYQTITLTHDTKNRISAVQYPDGHIVRIEYEFGSLYPTHIYHEELGIESPYLNYHLAYDNWGNINQVTDGKNQATSLVYDSLDRIVQVTNALNEITYYRYDDRRLDEMEIGATATDGEGQVYKFLYTPKQKLKSVQRKDDAGVFQTLWQYGYDSAGNMLHATDAMNRQWTYTYDYLDRLTSVTDPLTYTWQYGYDVLGNITSVIDAEQRQTLYEYNAHSRLTKMTEQGVSPALVTRFVYDAMGNITQVIDPKNQVTQYDYDLLSRLVRETKPLQQAIQYAYDDRGRLDYLINERNQKIDYDYEPWGALKYTYFYLDPTSATAVKQRSRDYDHNGNLTSIVDTGLMSTPVYTMSYDALDRIDTLVNLAFSPYRQLDYDYDRYGNVSQLQVSNSTTANGTDWVTEFTHQYQFNRQDLLKQATFNAGQPIAFDYYPSDELKQIAYNSGTQTHYAYYGNGPLKWVDVVHNSQSKEKIRFTYDKVMNVKEMAGSQGMHRFAYDGIDRLISASHPLGTNLPVQEDYTYDPAGNREDASNDALYDYDANNRIQQSPAASSYVFDDSGNLIQRGADESFVYDYENQLTQYSNTATGVVANYRYDPFGRRIKKEVTQSGVTTTTHYLWDGQDLIAEFDGAGNRTKRYAYSPNRYAPLQMEDASGMYEVHTDHLDAPVVLTDQAGNVVWRAVYEAYGNAQVDEDVDGNGQSVTFDLRRPGQWLDDESGLFYNYFRYYDPLTGRYITSDPIGLLGGLNVYAYVEGNPLNYNDSLGLGPSRRRQPPSEGAPMPFMGNGWNSIARQRNIERWLQRERERERREDIQRERERQKNDPLRNSRSDLDAAIKQGLPDPTQNFGREPFEDLLERLRKARERQRQKELGLEKCMGPSG